MKNSNNYIVLARKYRPQKLSEIIGQEETCKIIEGSVKLDRIAHAYLFSGTRGVGKTTLARILAKIVNCLNLSKEMVEPCGNCKNCESIDFGNNIDVVEIDAASKTGVADVREIIDNVNYKPVSAKKKIFIIDEVHMLSKAAFNALLKTLEEPPIDVIFIFATTETEKIPLTILSRCQRFQLKRVDTDLIGHFLKEISKKEGFEIELEGCNLIAQSAEGSVRDSLSILDNVLTRGNPVRIQNIKTVIGLSDNNLVLKLLRALFEGDPKVALDIFEDLYSKGASVKILSQTLMNLTYHSMRIKSEVDIESLHLEKKILETVEFVAKNFEMDFLIRFWELMQKYINEINNCFDEKQFFEMTIMRLCFISLVPTPFELLKENESIKNEDKIEIKAKTKTESNVSDNTIKKSNDADTTETISNLALEPKPKKIIEPENKTDARINNLARFKKIVDKIENKSEMQIAHHLRTSFKLVTIKDNNNIREIELENISENKDSRKILWKASKLISEIEKERWTITLSSRKGFQSLKEYERTIEKNKIIEICNDNFVKKILEIIPSSEVTSIQELENDKLKKREENE